MPSYLIESYLPRSRSGELPDAVGRLRRVSPKTVEGHLSRIYGKLGLASRTELAHRLGRHDP